MKNLLGLTILFLLLHGCSIANSLEQEQKESDSLTKKTETNTIKILDHKALSLKTIDGISFSEVSDLAFNPQNGQLYMIGDKGNFYLFKAKFTDKIEQIEAQNAYKIKGLKERHLDSEGLTMDNKGQLYASFEKKPMICKISKKGQITKKLKLPKKIATTKNFRNRNKIFEALTYHPKYGLLTASEYPIKKDAIKKQTIYSLKGKEWHFKAEKYQNSAITAIETMDDGNLLILERAYAGIFKPFVITLKKLYVNKCNKKRQCETEVLATFNSAEGWSVNNYEGLTKVGKNRYVMVSDNNKKSFLNTVLIYFEVKE